MFDRRVTRVAAAVALLLTVVMAPACAASADRSPYAYTLRGATMGTSYTVRIADTDQPGREQELHQLVQKTLDGINARMSTYEGSSEVSRLNRAAAGAPVQLSADTFKVLAAALALGRDSGGAFDPTVGGLVDAWGFGPAEPTAPPSAAEIAALRAHVGFDKIQLDTDRHTARRLDAGVQVDLSAIAKGYAVDAVAQALEAAGLNDLMVEVGGEVVTRGSRGGEPWHIGIERPEVGTDSLQRRISLHDEALATSGNYRNFHVVDGRRVGHTIDPRTGQPVQHNGVSVSVLHEECMMADGLATTLMVMGPAKGLTWARERGVAALFIVLQEDAFVERSTSEFDVAVREPVAPGD